jgi:uncharacterized protein (DUF302 family)
MLYEREAKGSVAEVAERVKAAAAANKFGVLVDLDLKQRMVEKGVEFGPQCRILEICNPQRAKQVLTANMAISTALPCRIAVYEQGGKVKVASIKPTTMLALYGATGMESVAREVEEAVVRIIDAACG